MELNLDTPLVYLTPSVAQNYQVSAYIYLVAVGALTWDWLMAIPDEYRILSRGGISFSKIVYISARVFTFAYCLSITILQVAPIHNCQSMVNAIGVLTILALNANNMLFLIRVCAVYGNSRWVLAFFGFWYLTIFGTSMGIPFVVRASHIGPTKYCLEANIPIWTASAMVCNIINDTLIFVAISHRIASRSIGMQNWCATLKAFFCGDAALGVTRVLLVNGQLCYLATILLSLFQIILAFVLEDYVGTLTIPVIALENAMTCRVHRAVILGLITDGQNHHRTTSGNPNNPFVLTTVVSGYAGGDSMVLDEMKGIDGRNVISQFRRGSEPESGSSTKDANALNVISQFRRGSEPESTASMV